MTDERDDREHLPSIARLKRDMVKAVETLSEDEVRYLVDGYYLIQDGRKRANSQIFSMKREPHEILAWLATQSEVLETQIKRALEQYTDTKLICQWLKSIFGIGPVISAGLFAHINIKEAPTAGHIWSFAGLNPDAVWERGQKRPWNPSLKVLTWKAGQSFMKFSNDERCIYGHEYKRRKKLEVTRNEAGDNAAAAARILTEKNWKKGTDAYRAYTSGIFPKAHVDARARRYAVKLLLSHLQMVWWYVEYHSLPKDPYPIAIKGHTHFVPPPGVELIPGLHKALAAKGWI